MNRLRRALWALGGCVLTVVWGTYVLSVLSFRQADASRNSSGTYSVFAGTTPVASLQTIGSGLWNNAWNDMAASMTDSLDRNGRGGMLAALRGIDGTVAAPAFSYTSETGTGRYRIGAGDDGWAILGVKKLELTGTLFTVVPNAQFSGQVGIGVASAFPLDISYSNSGGGTAETGIQLKNTSTTNSTQIRMVSNRDWSIFAAGSAGAPAGGLAFRDNTSGVTPFSINNTDGVVIGATGTAISASYGATYSVAFGSPANGVCTLSTQTLTGVALGGVCVASVDSGIGSSTIFDCSATGANSITVRGCNVTGGAFTIGTLNVRVRVFQP